MDLVADGLVVRIDVVERVVEQVTEDGGDAVVLREEAADSLGSLEFLAGALPFLHQTAELGVEHGCFLALGGRTYDDSVVFRKNTVYKALQALFLGLGGYLLGDAYLVVERKEHHIPSGYGDLGGQT